MSWQGRVAVVTGIARPAGIGQACAKLLFKQGFSIVGIDREAPTFAVNVPWINRGTAIEEAPPAADTAAAAEATPKVAWIMCDLSQQDQILSLPSQLDDLGVSAVNVLVNNAGIADPYMQSDTISERAKLWSKYIAVNLSAPFLLSEVLRPLLVSHDSSIIHTSSTRALQSEPHCEVGSQQILATLSRWCCYKQQQQQQQSQVACICNVHWNGGTCAQQKP